MFKFLLLSSSDNTSDQIGSILHKYFDDVSLVSEPNALEGVFKLTDIAPDIILIDYANCDIDVFHLISLLKKNSWTTHIPLISIVDREAMLQNNFLARTYDAEIDGFIYRPILPLETLPILRLVLKLRQNSRGETTMPSSASGNRYQHDISKNGYFLNDIILDDIDKKYHCRFVKVNKQFEQLTGLTSGEVLNKDLSEIFTEINKDNVSSFYEIIRVNKTIKFQQYFPETNKQLEITAFSPQVNKIAAIVTEVGQKRNEEEMGKSVAYNNYNAIDELKTSFLANLSHEIRTPLNAIMGFSTLLGFDDVQEDKKHLYLRQIKKSGGALLSIIEEMLDLAKIQSGMMEINKTSFNLKMVLLNVERVAKLSLQEKEKSNAIELKIDHSNPLNDICLTTDKKRLEQVIVKLIDNAIKYTEKGEIKLSVELKQESNYDSKKLHISVRDTGIGIPQEKQDEIFGIFSQLDNEQTLKYGGTGIGLSVSKKIVHNLGGEMWVESETGNGSCFSFVIPVSVTASDMEIYSYKEKKKVSDVYDWSSKKILLADDEEMNLFFLEEMLYPTNIKILYAENGIEVMERYEANKDIDIILMDMRMPFQDGYETTKQLKEQYPDLTIIAQTTLSQYDDKTDIFEVGCDECLEKPIDKKRLFTILSRFLGK